MRWLAAFLVSLLILALAVACEDELRLIEEPDWPASSATPVATATPTPTPGGERIYRGTVLPYSVVGEEDVSMAPLGLYRGVVRIVISDDATPEQTLSTLSLAMDESFDRHPEWDAITLFAYSDRYPPPGLFSKGKAVASTNGKGWDGEGTLDGFRDVGQIIINIVTKGTYIDGQFVPEELGLGDICFSKSVLWDLCQDRFPSLRE